MTEASSSATRRGYWEVGVAIGAAMLVGIVFLWPTKVAPKVESVTTEHVPRARMLRQSGEVELALVELGKALATDTTNRDANFELAEILRDRGRADAAKTAYQQALASNEDASARIGLGLIALGKGDVEAAIAAFRRATVLDPGSAVAHLDLGIALLNADRAAEAIPVCERATALAPENLDARHNLGFALRKAGRGPEAVAILGAVVARDPTRVISLYELGSAQVDAGLTPAALKTFAALLVLDPGHAAAKARVSELSASP